MFNLDVVIVFELPYRAVILRQVKLTQEIAAVHPIAVCSNQSVVDAAFLAAFLWQSWRHNDFAS